MKKYRVSLSLSLLLTTLVSCSDQFDMKYVDEWSEDVVWSGSETAQAVLNDLYTGIAHRPDSYSSNFLDAATDNAVSGSVGGTVNNLSQGNISTTNNPLDNWTSCYTFIQHANLFIERGNNNKLVYSFSSKDTHFGMKARLMGEAYFMRAYYSFQLLQIYGGKSNSGDALGYIINTKFTSSDEAEAMMTNYKRNTYEECIEQIMSDLDTAIEYLSDPLAQSVLQVGRANREVAHALKSRVALYGASPAYQPNSITKINAMGDFSVVDEDSYQEKWERAALASYMAIKTVGYVMYGLNPNDLADAPSVTPMEHIFRFYYSNRSIETLNFLPRYLGKSYTAPTQNLVDAFPMANGYPYDHANANYDENDPYAGRDKRFYLNVYYNGADYGSETYMSDDTPLTKVDILPDGADAPDKSRYSSRTGYYLAKFVSKNFNCNDPTGANNSAHYWAVLRRTELYLNYAEAANEAFGPTGRGSYVNEYGSTIDFSMSAYDAIKIVRETSGGITDTGYLDEMAQSKETMRTLIQNERRIELTFENQRFFDMRRWVLPLNEPVYGVEASYGSNGEVVYTRKEIEKRRYDDVKFYYLPVPYTEVVKGLENNMGW